MASQQRCLHSQASPSNLLFSNLTQWSPRQPDFSYPDCIYGYADLANSCSDHSSFYQQQSHCEGAATDKSSVHLTASKATHVAETSTCLTANPQSKAPKLPIKALFSLGDSIGMSANQARFADALLESIRLGQYSLGDSAQLECILERYECSINHSSSFFPQSDNNLCLRATLDASKELHINRLFPHHLTTPIWCPNNSTSAEVNSGSDNLQCRRRSISPSAASFECRYHSMSQNTAPWPQSASQ